MQRGCRAGRSVRRALPRSGTGYAGPHACHVVLLACRHRLVEIREPAEGCREGSCRRLFSLSGQALARDTRVNETVGFLNGGHLFRMNALKCEDLTDGIMLGRRLAQEYVAFYHKYVSGCENMQLVATASLIGVRESRRIVGEYELNYDGLCGTTTIPRPDRHLQQLGRHPSLRLQRRRVPALLQGIQQDRASEAGRMFWAPLWYPRSQRLEEPVGCRSLQFE